MKQWFAKYSRPCRAAIMLLVVYSSHLFSFHSLIASPGQFLTGILKNADQKPTSNRHTDCLLLLSKHSLVPQKAEANSELLLATSLSLSSQNRCYSFNTFAGTQPQKLSNDSYKLYRRLRTLLI